MLADIIKESENEDLFLGFYHLSKAWYAEANLKGMDYVDEICFGIYHKEGGCKAEAIMKWYPIQNYVSPRLEMFDDSFELFDSMPQVFNTISGLNQDFTPDEFASYLIGLGFTDKTPLQYGD